MGRTAVACLILAATFGFSGAINATSAAASPVQVPGKHIPVAKENRHAATPAENKRPESGQRSQKAHRRRPRPRMKTVRFGGYAVSVPAGWPVYRLGPRSARCVRYDVNAVYLGTPGTDQRCPAHLVGQTDTVSIAPPAAGGAASRPGGPAVVLQSAQVGGGERRQRPGVSVSATYGPEPGLIRRVLHSLRVARTGHPVALRQSALAPATGRRPAAHASRLVASHAVVTPSQVPSSVVSPSVVPPSVVPPHAPRPPAAASPAPASPAPASPAPASPVASGSPSPLPTPTASLTARISVPVRGFDTCTAPSLDAMRAWRKRYSAVAIYIGGANMGCGYGNLSASWVRKVRKMDWSLIPIYVGLQAPCNSFGQEIEPRHASSEGTGAANSAVLDAKSFGLGKGGPIYFDMEAYNSGRRVCRDSVLSFLDKWTRQLHARGYVSGVYSSAASGAEDLGNATTVYGRRVAKPDSLWFALWDNRANLVGTPYLLRSWWSPGRRIKQYEGPRWEKVGGIKLNIDSDWVQGAVY